MEQIYSERGQSLVQVLVSLAIMAIFMQIFLTTITAQGRETKALTEKLASLELERSTIALFSNETACSYNLTTGPNTFNSTLIGSENPPTLELPKLLSAPVASAPEFVTVGSSPLPLAPDLVVSSIQLTNIQSAGIADLYNADLQVSFDASRLIRPIKPISMKIQIGTSGPDNAKVIQTCGNAAVAAAAAAAHTCRRVVSSDPPTKGPSKARCDAGETLTSGGGECVRWDGTNWVYDHDDVAQTYASFIHSSYAEDQLTWTTDCARVPGTTGAGMALAHAICCKN